jgi:hypothetical protein
LEEKIRAVKQQRTHAVILAHARTVLAAGLAVHADEASRFSALTAFVTLAAGGCPAPVETVRQLLAFRPIFGYGGEMQGLLSAANSMCGQLSAFHSRLLHDVFHDLLSCAPSLTVWCFLSLLSRHCHTDLSSAVRTEYGKVLSGVMSGLLLGQKRAASNELIWELEKCVFDVEWRDEQGNTLFLACVNAGCRADDMVMWKLVHQLGATPWVSNSITKQTALHIWMDKKLFFIVRDILMEQHPWGTLLPLLDWWAPDDQGRTPLQLAQSAAEAALLKRASRPLEATDRDAIEVAELLSIQLQHWKQTERPLLVQSLVEHASLCSDVAQLVVSYVDGQDRA